MREIILLTSRLLRSKYYTFEIIPESEGMLQNNKIRILPKIDQIRDLAIHPVNKQKSLLLQDLFAGILAIHVSEKRIRVTHKIKASYTGFTLQFEDRVIYYPNENLTINKLFEIFKEDYTPYSHEDFSIKTITSLKMVMELKVKIKK